MKKFSCLFFLLLSGSIAWLHAQTAEGTVFHEHQGYTITDKYPAQDLASVTDIFVDQNRELTIESIRQTTLQGQFRPYEEVRSEPYQTEAAYWLRIHLQAEVEITDWWLLLTRDGDTEFLGVDYRYLTNNDQVMVYYEVNGRILNTYKTGTYVPFSQKQIKTEARISRVPFSIRPGQTLTIYLRSADLKKNQYFRMRPELRDPKFNNLFDNSAEILDVGVLMAIQAVLGFLLLAFFFFTRERSFFLLGMMCVCLFLHYPILNPLDKGISFYVPEHPFWIEYLWILFTHSTYLFLILFIRDFTNLKAVSPKWDKLALLALLLLSTSMLVNFIKIAKFPLYETNMVFIFLAFVLILILIVRIVALKSLEAKVVGVGVFFMIFFNLLGVLWQLEFLTLPFIPWPIGQVGLVFILTIGLAIRMQRNERAKAEADRIREVDAIKSRFFANISHEFRTPLTLILNPLKKIEEQIPVSDLEGNGTLSTQVSFPTKYIHLMRRNADRLLQLINQLLDLSKLESGQLHLQLQQGKITPLLRAMVFSFESLAERKQIYFQTQFPEDVLTGFYDEDKLEKIITNLLSNAFKYTPEQGTISVRLSGDQQRIRIQVKDTGMGMKKEDLEKIFDRFYQVEGTEDQGSGIGLSLVKELVTLHHGQISVDSMPGHGTTFKVSLPIARSFFEDTDIVERSRVAEAKMERTIPVLISPVGEEVLSSDNGKSKNSLPRILIVEDNPDLLYFITEHLNSSYQVIKAVDGKQGLELALEHQPELIVSDVMMPKMNGTDMCAQLKTNEITSHIPIILLTAKAGQQDKLAGLETGADAYLTKPFDGEELSLRVAKLIEQRQRMRQQFSKTMKLSPKEVAVTSVDEQFLRSVMERIEANIDNEYFSVEDLAAAVSMSRSHLHRKLKALCDQSPNQLIRNFRLERAKELLEKKAGNISEIAFQVGYSSLSYFTKSFKAQYGCLPSEVE